jgi:tRNA (mo5U34)-methyltransferase
VAETQRRAWYHTIDLPDGTSTPGYFDTRPVAEQITWPAGLQGGRCLDVGTFDGFWAFEMEKRGGAEVVALDLDDPAELDWTYDERVRGPEVIRQWGAERGPGFAETSQALGSSVTRVAKSVYDLDPDVDGQFDVVFCGALLLHLRDPLRALEAMRTVCRGELVLAETVDPFLDIVAKGRPAARFHPDWDQWWQVNSAGLVEMVTVAGFEMQSISKRILLQFGAGSTDAPPPWLNSLVTLQPRRRGVALRALRARPRERRPRQR